VIAGWMSGPTFTPSVEVAEMNRIHFELEFTEGISQRMRIPETLKVAPESQRGPVPLQQPLPPHATLMQVPERIVVAGTNRYFVCIIKCEKATGQKLAILTNNCANTMSHDS